MPAVAWPWCTDFCTCGCWLSEARRPAHAWLMAGTSGVSQYVSALAVSSFLLSCLSPPPPILHPNPTPLSFPCLRLLFPSCFPVYILGGAFVRVRHNFVVVRRCADGVVCASSNRCLSTATALLPYNVDRRNCAEGLLRLLLRLSGQHNRGAQ